MKKKTNKMNFFAKVFISIFGIIFAVIGLSTYLITKQKVSNMIETEATVIHSSYNDEYYSSTEVEYIVNDATYVAYINYSSSSLYPGKKINVYYSPDDYYNVVYAKGNYILSIIFVCIGTSFFIGFIIMSIIMSGKTNGYKKLIEKGYSVNAEFVEVEMNRYVSINNRYPYRIVCNYEESGVKYTFKSENIWDDPTEIINEKNINYFRVFVEESNYKKYYMDISEIQEEI